LFQLFSSENNNTFFLGKSGQELFDMKYVKQNEYGETGDFLEIQLKNRANNLNNISGVNHYNSKFLLEDIYFIRNTKIKKKELAIKYNVGIGTINRIINNKYF
jgi:hypothetical protein